MATQHMAQLRDTIQTRLGIDMTAGRGIQLADLINPLSGGDVAAYLAQLQNTPETAPVWQTLIDALTIGETYFFRNRAQFAMLREQILPALTWQNRDTRRLRVWCAGCATGEEPYSVAMTLLDALPDPARWTVQVLGTDISQRALTTAQQGIYRREWSFRHDDDDQQRRYFTRTNNGYHVRGDVRRLVSFQWMNLVSARPQPPADLILCRNVMLYFHRDARRQSEQTLQVSLRPGGWLMLGQSEALLTGRDTLHLETASGAFAYRKPTPSAARTPPTRLPQTDDHIRLTSTLPPPSADMPGDRDTLYAQAVDAFHAEAHDHAEQLLSRLLDAEPRDVYGRVLLAAVFANRGAAAEAQMHLNAALRYDPLCADAHYLRAMLYLENQMTEKAMETLRRALYSQAGHPLAAFLLGTLQAQAGNPRRARNLWEQALAAVRTLPPDRPISDFNPRTASDFAVLVQNELLRLD